MSMSNNDNIKRLFRREGFDFIPPHFDLCPSQVEVFKQKTGSSQNYREYYDFPWTYMTHPIPDRGEVEPDWSVYFDEELSPDTQFSPYGIAREPHGEDAMHMKRMHHPMKKFDSLEQFEAFPYPTYAKADVASLKEQVEAIHSTGRAAMAVMAMTLWEAAWTMRSMEELMMDMMTDSPLAEYHFDRLRQTACEKADAFARAGVDLIHFGDDIGMQKTIMMSEDMYRTWLKPRFRDVIAAAKNAKPDIIVTYHSCGYVIPFIPDLLEVGVQVLNPVQPECMSFEELHTEFSDRLSFWGTLGTQTLIPFGTPEEVRTETLRNLEIAGEKGGLLPTPSHLVEPEVPWENIMAYVDACREFSGR